MDGGYDLTDPKHVDYHDRMSSLADERRKAEREGEPISQAAREAVEDLLGVGRLDISLAPLVPSWTEKDARECVSHLGYYEEAEEAGARVILSDEERRVLASARDHLERLDAPSDVEVLLMGLGVASLAELKQLVELARVSYSQADLDFFADNADEYFEMANAQRARAERVEAALREIARLGVRFDAKGSHSARVVKIAQEALAKVPAGQVEQA